MKNVISGRCIKMRLLLESELCDILRVDRLFLWRCRQKGMPYIRLGTKMVRYRLEDVLEWLEITGEKSGEKGA